MFIDVQTAERVEEAVPDDINRGICTGHVPHTAAGVIVNEHEKRLLSDVEAALERLVPRTGECGHDAIDDNADAHLRATLLGESVTVPIVDGALALGTRQSILFVDCDGPRTRRLRVTVVSTSSA